MAIPLDSGDPNRLCPQTEQDLNRLRLPEGSGYPPYKIHGSLSLASLRRTRVECSLLGETPLTQPSFSLAALSLRSV
jgi:hypothetical protein